MSNLFEQCPYYYDTFGLKIRSEFEFPELTPSVELMSVDILICFGSVTENMPGATIVSSRVQIKNDSFQIFLPGVARYRVRCNEEPTHIKIEPVNKADIDEIRLYLLNTVMVALFHRMGRITLHCSAVCINNKSYAFCGPSGVGKSTLVASLYREGYSVLCDDIAVAILDENNNYSLAPGIPTIKLWKHSLDFFNIDAASLRNDLKRFDKYHYQPEVNDINSPVPLHRIYFLLQDSINTENNIPPSWSPDISENLIQTVRHHNRVLHLLENTYRPVLMRTIGNQHKHFLNCQNIASFVSMKYLYRPSSFENNQNFIQKLLMDIEEC